MRIRIIFYLCTQTLNVTPVPFAFFKQEKKFIALIVYVHWTITFLHKFEMVEQEMC